MRRRPPPTTPSSLCSDGETLEPEDSEEHWLPVPITLMVGTPGFGCAVGSPANKDLLRFSPDSSFIGVFYDSATELARFLLLFFCLTELMLLRCESVLSDHCFMKLLEGLDLNGELGEGVMPPTAGILGTVSKFCLVVV